MVRDGERACWETPIRLADDVIFEVLQWSVFGCREPGVQYLTQMEVFRPGYDYAHWFFHIYLCRTLFQRGNVHDTEDSILRFTRTQVWDFLSKNCQPMALSRYGETREIWCE